MYTGGGLFERVLKQAGDLNTLADLGSWAPGLTPVYVVGLFACVLNDIAAAGAVSFDKRPTFGSDTSRGDGDIGVLNFTTSHTGGKIVYKMITPVKISPGEEVVAEVTNVTGASDTADVGILLSPSPDVPGNITALMLSA